MIPLRPYNLQYAQVWPKHIIIHHTAEVIGKPPLKFASTRFQVQKLMKLNYRLNQETDLPYHFVIDMFKEDYQVVAAKPLFTKVTFDDLDPIYETDIHVGLLGDYDHDLPKNRLYKVLAYRLLIPLMRVFRLTEDRVYLHYEISNDSEVICPGEFIDRKKLLTHIRAMIRRRPIARK